MDKQISFSDHSIDHSVASSIDQEQEPSILMSTLSITDGASLMNAAEVDVIKDDSALAQPSSSDLQTKNEYTILVAMLRAYFEQKRPGMFDCDLFDLLGHSLTSSASDSDLLLEVDGDRMHRFFAVLCEEASTFVAFSSATADSWKRSLLPSLVASFEVVYTEERFRRELNELASEVRRYQDAKAELAANRRALAEKTALIDGLLRELLDEALTKDGALAKEKLTLEKAVKEEKMRLEELQASKAGQKFQAERLEETREEKLRRLTQQNARLTGKRDFLRQQKAIVQTELDPELVNRFKMATQALKFTTEVFRKN